MTQIVVTLENGADTTFLRKMIENMKGVLKTSVKGKKDKQNSDAWIKQMQDLSNSLDASMIDMTDERTRYIMSK